ncbi:MAG: hypothetical protein HUU01_11925 [Saprospiraceae bacterium]|nr:hypothetical protein [Saprospiraceae bacterium]
MKKSLLFALTLLACTTLQAQQETLFDDLDIVGAFGGPIVEIGNIVGETTGMVGGGGAIILNSAFIGGYGLGTSSPDYAVDGNNYNIRFRHGGFWLGYTYKSNKVIHLYTSARIGWGKIRLRDDDDTVFSDRVFALTPEVGVELNLTRWFRLGLTGGYRWVNGVNRIPGADSGDFSTPVGVLTFSFGGFGDWDRSDW